MTRKWLLLPLAAALCLAWPAEAPKDRKPPPWEKPLAAGRILFRQNCSVCHEINKPESKKYGPSLFRLFQNEKTPLTGFPPTEEYVIAKIKTGGVVMPAFGNILTDDQISKILAFVRSRH